MVGDRRGAHRQGGRWSGQVVWTREEDIQHDVSIGPVYRDTITPRRCRTGKDRPAGKVSRISGSSVMARWFPAGFQKRVDIDGVDSAIDDALRHPELPGRFRPRGAAGRANRILARRRSQQQACLRSSALWIELARKAGQGSELNSVDRDAWKPAAFSCRAQPGRREKSTGRQPLPARVGRGVCPANRLLRASSRPWWRRKSTSRAR